MEGRLGFMQWAGGSHSWVLGRAGLAGIGKTKGREGDSEWGRGEGLKPSIKRVHAGERPR